MKRDQWVRVGAVGGLLFVVLQLVAQGLIQAGGAEPSFSAGAGEIVAFFGAKDPGLFHFADFLNALSALGFVWFLGSLWVKLGGRDGQASPGQLIAVASGVMAQASVAGASGWPLAVFRGSDLDPQLARYLFDQGNYGFATLWVFMASMLLAVGVSAGQSGGLPQWLRWLAVATAVGLLVARAFWATESGLAFLPYMVFWIWLIAVCVLWLRKPGHAGEPSTREVA